MGGGRVNLLLKVHQFVLQDREHGQTTGKVQALALQQDLYHAHQVSFRHGPVAQVLRFIDPTVDTHSRAREAIAPEFINDWSTTARIVDREPMPMHLRPRQVVLEGANHTRVGGP